MLPSVLFVTTCELSPDTLIEKVLSDNLSTCSQIDDQIKAYPWFIDNKYYTTDINLCALNSKCLSNEQFAASVDGIVIVFDAYQPQCLENVETWLPFLDCYEADVKMLVCTSCPEDASMGVCKINVLEWCIQRGFELIELDPSDDDVDPEDDFPETTGVERIRQALHAHQWDNLVMKEHEQARSVETRNEDESDEDLSDGLAGSFGELLMSDSFTDLYPQMSAIKERIGRLSGQARHDAAEQVVLAFWNALGGDADDL